MEPTQAAGIAGFLTQTDGVGKAALVVLLADVDRDLVSHHHRSIQRITARRRTERFLETFWDAPSVQAVAAHLEEHHPDEPFSHLAWHGIVAARHHQRHGANKLTEAGSTAEFVTRAMRRVIDEETARFESGLTVLASVGSTAPFVGLFGTVWARVPRAGQHRHERPGHARQGRRSRGRGADHDRARAGGRRSRGAGLQRLRALEPDDARADWTASRTISSPCSPPART